MFDSQWLTRVQCHQLSFHPRFLSWRLVGRSIALYGAVLIVGTGFFFFLHYVGNQIPYDLAVRRFSTDYALNLPYERISPRHLFYQHLLFYEGERDDVIINHPWQHCEISLLVAAGASRDERYNAFRDTMILKTFRSWHLDENYDAFSNVDTGLGHVYTCYKFMAMTAGLQVATFEVQSPRYWYGSKVLYALALRHLSLFDVHQFIRFGTYGVYLLLAASLALMGWRVFLIGSPIVVLGIFLSAIEYFPDIGNGIPYLFALLAVSVLCLLMWRKASARAVWLSCFITGMVSQYLFYFDGHYIFLIPMMVFVVWLGYQHIKPGERARMVAVCIALYFVGFVSCFMLSQTVKVVVAESDQERVGRRAYITGPAVISEAFRSVSGHMGRTVREALAPLLYEDYALDNRCGLCTDGISRFEKLPVMRDLGAFWGMSKMSGATSNALSVSSALGLLSALFIAWFNSRRGNPRAMQNLLFMIVLVLVICLMFTSPDDSPFRKARFAFILIAVCWSCLIMALMDTSRRMVLSVGSGFVIPWLLTVGWWGANVVSTDVLTRGSEMVARSDFDIYMNEDRLIYVKDDCDDADVTPKFFLHIIPVDAKDLPEDSLIDGFDGTYFFFQRNMFPFMSGNGIPFLTRCATSIDLPEYEIKTIHTGQFTQEGRVWDRTFNPDAIEVMDDLAGFQRDGYAPVVRSYFDVYLEDGELIYFKSPCDNKDIDARIFLHVYPMRENDLPQERRELGFDNLGFTLSKHGIEDESGCVGAIDLPEYPIVKIITGQDEEGERIWGGTIHMPVLQVRDNLREFQSRDLMPVIQSDFDVYLDGDKLTYAKSLCDEADRDARFFLHVKPADANDLSQDRKESGFDNLDFILGQNGGRIGDECLAEIQLPSYEISEITTGLLDEKGERIWDDKISIGD